MGFGWNGLVAGFKPRAQRVAAQRPQRQQGERHGEQTAQHDGVFSAEPVAGRPVIRMRLRPAAGYGDGEPLRHNGTHNICFHTPTLRYRVTTNASRTALQDGDWTVLDGPLAFDNAVSMVAAKTKGIKSAVAGQADILVVPDLESGNMVAKQLEYLAGAVPAGIVLGAKVPIILTSRADNAETRMASCVLAVLIANANQKK